MSDDQASCAHSRVAWRNGRVECETCAGDSENILRFLMDERKHDRRALEEMRQQRDASHRLADKHFEALEEATRGKNEALARGVYLARHALDVEKQLGEAKAEQVRAVVRAVQAEKDRDTARAALEAAQGREAGLRKALASVAAEEHRVKTEARHTRDLLKCIAEDDHGWGCKGGACRCFQSMAQQHFAALSPAPLPAPAKGDGLTDDTAAVQRAYDTGTTLPAPGPTREEES